MSKFIYLTSSKFLTEERRYYRFERKVKVNIKISYWQYQFNQINRHALLFILRYVSVNRLSKTLLVDRNLIIIVYTIQQLNPFIFSISSKWSDVLLLFDPLMGVAIPAGPYPI